MCATCEEWLALCALPRLPSEWPTPLRLSPLAAFRFNRDVLRASRTYRISEAEKIRAEDDGLGVDAIIRLLSRTYSRG